MAVSRDPVSHLLRHHHRLAANCALRPPLQRLLRIRGQEYGRGVRHPEARHPGCCACGVLPHRCVTPPPPTCCCTADMLLYTCLYAWQPLHPQQLRSWGVLTSGRLVGTRGAPPTPSPPGSAHPPTHPRTHHRRRHDAGKCLTLLANATKFCDQMNSGEMYPGCERGQGWRGCGREGGTAVRLMATAVMATANVRRQARSQLRAPCCACPPTDPIVSTYNPNDWVAGERPGRCTVPLSHRCARRTAAGQVPPPIMACPHLSVSRPPTPSPCCRAPPPPAAATNQTGELPAGAAASKICRGGTATNCFAAACRRGAPSAKALPAGPDWAPYNATCFCPYFTTKEQP